MSSSPLTRRQLLQASAASAALGALGAGCADAARTQWPGKVLGAPAALGHRLREKINSTAPAATQRVPVVIVGGGVAGLAAAYALRREGVRGALLLEMLDAPGGNSRSGRNAVSRYPWGAHYLPLPRADCAPVLNLLGDLGVLRDFDAAGLPVYDEYALSADPQERLWMLGRWQEGLVPLVGASAGERAQFAAFFAEMARLKQARGRDGRPLFAIPLDQSSSDGEWRALDALNMRDWLLTRGWNSPRLHWYINYCCRDDFGCESAVTSAWAGIHYFAARNGVAANASPDTVLTWPQGNAFLAEELQRRSDVRSVCNALVTRVARTAQGVVVDYVDVATNTTLRVEADAAVVCLPRFIAARVVEGLGAEDARDFSYAPWMVANLTLNRLPGSEGEPLAWDNVIYGGRLLGYVNATHQGLEQWRRGTVLTYYWPLSHLPPADARRFALDRSLADWQGDVAAELLRVHPELREHIENFDVWVWGHGMVRPTPGFIWGAQRGRVGEVRPPIYLAHSDLSGVSIFEEAYCRGFAAGSAAARELPARRVAA